MKRFNTTKHEEESLAPGKSQVLIHGTLCNAMWQPQREGNLGGMDTCMCMSESLHCQPETVTTLLIGSTPIQNKKLKKNFF